MKYLALVGILLAGCVGQPESVVPQIDRSKYQVTIERDKWGIPHVHGVRDADTAFGFAYAQAEDGWELIQETMPFYRGESARYNGIDAAPADYMIHWLGVRDWVAEGYASQLTPKTRLLVEAYTDGLNYFAEKHPDRVDRSMLPITKEDVITGFVVRHLMFYGFDQVLKEVVGPTRAREVAKLTADLGLTSIPIGSNAIAVAPPLTDDGATRLMINSHQPTDGPVAWYEAHISSDEGLDIMGGTFPGSPLISLGFNDSIAWGVTVNKPDVVDVYVLEMNPDNPDQYRLDGEWKNLEKTTVDLAVKILGPLVWTVNRDIYRSEHGPVMKTDHGVYALRFGGQGEIRQVEQWYAMNRAKNRDQWLDAMRLHRFASFNFVFADRDGNTSFIHNSMTPKRKPGYDWQMYLPGDDSSLIWTEYLAFDELPQVHNPSHGFLTSTNQTPFAVAHDSDNPNESEYSPTDGYQTRMTNRAVRSLELLDSLAPISREDFAAIKYDKAYSPNSRAGRYLAAAIKATAQTENELYQQARSILSAWDLNADIESRGAALGVCIISVEWKAEQDGIDPPAPGDVLETCADKLMAIIGRLDPTWGSVNRHTRGDINVPIGGAPDTLRAIYGVGLEEQGYLQTVGGDGLYYLVSWHQDGELEVEGVHHYGSATMQPESPHYADQAENFAAERTHPPLFTRAQREAAGNTRRYQP